MKTPVYCIRCDEEIPAKRLAAVPATRRCRSCAELIDSYNRPRETAMACNSEGAGEILLRAE